MDYRPIWGIRSTMNPALSVMTPQRIATEAFTDAAAAVVRLDEIYERNTHFLRDCFEAYVNGAHLSFGAKEFAGKIIESRSSPLAGE